MPDIKDRYGKEMLRAAEPFMLFDAFKGKMVTVKRSFWYMFLQVLRLKRPRRYEKEYVVELPKADGTIRFRRRTKFNIE